MAESSQQRYERSKEIYSRISELEQKLAIAKEALEQMLEADLISLSQVGEIARNALEKLE